MRLRNYITSFRSGKTSRESSKCITMAQKVKVLLWKMYVLRKRHWIITLLEVGVPIIVFWLVVHFKNMLPEQKQVVSNTYTETYKNFVTHGVYKIAYTPISPTTDSIMRAAVAQLNASNCLVTLTAWDSEADVVSWLRQEYNRDSKNVTFDFSYYTSSPKGVGVVFLDSKKNNLKYVIRTTRGYMETTDKTLYGEQNGDSTYSYKFSGFTTVQTAIDQAHLSLFHKIEVSNRTFVGNLPFIEYLVVDLVEILLPTIISLGFTFVMPSLLREVVEEKTSGIKEMMKIMGLKSWINWLNWVMYSMIVYVPVTFVITGLLTIDSGTGPSIHANFFCVWFMFMLFTFAFITLIFATSTFFTNGTIAMIAGEIVWYGATIVLDTFIVELPDRFSLWVNLLTCLCPSVALIWAFNTFNNFHKSGHEWTLAKLFDDGAGGGRVSVGLAVIMLCVDIVLYSAVTWYIDNVNPGPYGRAKPLTFIFKRCKKKERNTNHNHSLGSHVNYESPPKEAKVGIRVEHLRKTFNHGKVEAVKNVDLDIYEGSITALLGHNGAGKSTTMSILAGFFSPSGGRVMVNDVNIFTNMEEFRSNLGLCPQHNLLFSFFTVSEHLIFFGMLKGQTMKESLREGKDLLTTLGVYSKRNELVSKLSGGMKRKLCLAIALIGNPKVLMLDEPTSGLDPESRRQVWDMLLSLRRQRTTIITTHFMEEADVLGDRIAIMDHGQVSCYGTSMFLKKLYGTGYHLNIAKAISAPEDPITQVVGKYVKSAVCKQTSPSQLAYTLKTDDSPQFPALFCALDRYRTHLGLTAVSISCTTMEDVFLSVTEKPEEKENSKFGLIQHGKYDDQYKATGANLAFLQFRALAYKRLLTRVRTWISTISFIAVPVLLMAGSMLKMMEQDYKPVQPSLSINLNTFPGVHVAVSSDSDHLTSILGQMVSSGKDNYDLIPPRVSLVDYMTEKIDSNLVQYERLMIAGFQAEKKVFIGGYSRYFAHSLPLVLNMMANSLLQMVSPSSSISLFNHPLAVKDEEDKCDLSMAAAQHVFNFPLHTIFLSLGLLILAMDFIAFPLKERVTHSKQLQLMSGVSPLLYWATNLFCDGLVYFITALLMICMVFIFQNDGILTTSGYTGALVLVFLLYGTSVIPFAYVFSFLVRSSVKASVLFVIINMVTGTFAGAFLAILDGSYSGYGVWRFFLSLNPVFSATSACIHLITAMYINGACIQCGVSCDTLDPIQFLESGAGSQNPHGINSFLIFMAVDTILYFGIVLMIEYGYVKKLAFFVSSCWIRLDNLMFQEDSDVLLERERVFALQNLRVLAGSISSRSILQVNDLGKKYNRKVTAVRGVTFQVVEGECFGLLGVNGAGKTTTFKMLTGEEIPNKGDASIIHYSLLRQKSKFLSKIGYCPQFDAIHKLLTGREMLRVYAMLRGIPASICDTEVSKWIQILGLKEYSDRRCGTYSGGNKRKLSTAMAFIGAPPVVFLDEPTSGVDPVSRRKLWDVVKQCQRAGQAIVLTSHSMEECEALCTRLTIMVGGQMKCIGSAQYLKHKFGQGYTIKIKLHPSRGLHLATDVLKTDVANQFSDCSIKDEHLGLLHYHIPDPSIRLSELFTKMEHLRGRHDIIEDYIVSDTTLEQVFMSFARATPMESA